MIMIVVKVDQNALELSSWAL